MRVNRQIKPSFRLLLAALGAVVLQIVVVPILTDGNTIDLLGALLVAAALHYTFRRLFLIALAGGLLVDLIAVVSPLGISIALYGGAILLTRLGRHFFHVRSFSLPALGVVSLVLILLHTAQRLFIVQAGVELFPLLGTIAAGLLAAIIVVRE